MATMSSREKPFLYSILPKMAQYLNVDLIMMYMFPAECLTSDEYENLMRIRDSGPNQKYRLCNEIALLVERRQTLKKFKKALDDSKTEHAGHEELLRLIIEAENAVEKPTHEPAVIIGTTEGDMSTAVEGLPDGPFSPTRKKSDPKDSITSVDLTTVNPSQGTDNSRRISEKQSYPINQEVQSNEDSASISSFCLGSLCAGLTVIVLILAGSGITLMYYAAEGWMGNVKCVIKMGTPVDTDPDPERSSIFAFNFISGFICLVIPTIFLLLLIYSIFKNFKKEMFDKSIVRKVLIGVIVAYIALCILIGVAQLALSIYIAILIYPNYRNYLSTLSPPPLNMTEPAPETTTISPSSGKFDCDQVVYLSAFISLTMMYLLIFILLAVLVGLYIASKVGEYFHYFVDDCFERCFEGFRAAGSSPGAGTGTLERQNTTASIALVENNDESTL